MRTLSYSLRSADPDLHTLERKDITSVPAGAYLPFTLSATGMGWVNKTGTTKLALREGHDVIDTPFVGNSSQYNQLQLRTSEYTGTTNDPVLEVTYTLPTPTTTITYAYDASGQRIKVTTPTTTTAYPSTWYNVDGMGKKTKHIMAGGAVAATLETVGTITTPHYVHTDQLTGSNVITSSTGAQEELTDYYPFGSIRLDEKTGVFSEQRKFTGYEYDQDTGLNYAGARYQNSALGRFISEDPMFWELSEVYLLDPQQQNSYSYARNNPLAYYDPSGLAPSALEAARMASQIYNNGHEGDDLIGGWVYNKSELGGDDMKMGIYSRVKQDSSTEYALVFKGTTPSNLDDWKNNLQQFFSESPDATAAIETGKAFTKEYSGNETTFVGHSKGGAEALLAGIATNNNVIRFNPALANITNNHLVEQSKQYTGHVSNYIVDGEAVSAIEGRFGTPIGDITRLQTVYSTPSWMWLVNPRSAKALSAYNSVQNHLMGAVERSLIAHECPTGCLFAHQ